MNYIVMVADAPIDAIPSIIPSLVFLVAAIVLACTAKRTAKAWRRLLLLSATLCFLLPISTLIFIAISAEAAGVAINDLLMLMGGYMAFVSFIPGIVS